MRHGREEEGEGQVSRASQAGKQFVRQTAYQDLGFIFLSQGKAGHGRAGQGATETIARQLPDNCLRAISSSCEAGIVTIRRKAIRHLSQIKALKGAQGIGCFIKMRPAQHKPGVPQAEKCSKLLA